MSQRPSAHTPNRRVLLIDAVVWSEQYPANDPLSNVGHWYSRWLTGLPEVVLHSVKAEEDLLTAVRAEVSGVIISGSPRNAWDNDPINFKLCEVVQECRDRGMPLLGVCYGHQLLARALGGEVGRHPGGLELGNTEVELTEAGRLSPLFDGLPRRFPVLSSHADAVLELPVHGELLVQGQFTLIQAFHWQHLLFGVQFHPETDPDTLRFIWSGRREACRPRVRFDLDRTLDNLQPTPHAGAILRNFVTRIVR